MYVSKRGVARLHQIGRACTMVQWYHVGDDMRSPSFAIRASRVVCSTLPFIFLSASAMSAPPLTQIRSFRLDAAPSKVFPLFTARGERAWAPGWDPEMLSGDEERASAFRTRNQHGQESVWIVTEFRPQE